MSKSMAKRLRQSLERRDRNRAVKTRIRSATRAALEAAQENNGGETSEAARLAMRLIDKAMGKGVLKKRTGARRKARLVRRLRALSASEEPVTEVQDEEAPEEESAEEEETEEDDEE